MKLNQNFKIDSLNFLFPLKKKKHFDTYIKMGHFTLTGPMPSVVRYKFSKIHPFSLKILYKTTLFECEP